MGMMASYQLMAAGTK